MQYNIYQPSTERSGLPVTKRKSISLQSATVMEYFACKHYFSNTTFAEENRLLVTLNGSVKLIYGKSDYVVGKGQMAFLRGNTLIEYQTIGCDNELQQTEFIIFSLGYDLVKEFSTLSQLTTINKTFNSEVVVSELNPVFIRFTNSLSMYFEDGVVVEETLVKIKLLELLYSLKNSENGFLELFLDLRKDNRPNITIVVEDNYMNSLSINQLARLAGRSLSSFRRDFISIYNMPPSQWIRDRRLKKSLEFLLNTNMTITDICYTLGFENIAHFSRLFKSYFGYSPSVYRQQLLSA